MRLLFANYTGTVPTLAGPITNTATALVVQAGQGALFPNPSQNQYFVITMIPAATGLPGEIMWCTARSADTLTVIRGQEGTTAAAYLAGDSVAPQVTAGALSAFAQIPTYAGNPNGSIAGQAGGAEESPDAVFDTTNRVIWVCTTGSTNPSSAVWTQIDIPPAVGSQARLKVANVSNTIATATADELVVSNTLGSAGYNLININLTLNTTTVGAGGMDTGSPPSNADLSIYVIYNPTTETAALLACAGSESNSTIYSGSHMPAGYTASCLVNAVVTSGTNLPGFTQFGRAVYPTAPTGPLGSGTATTATAVSCAAGVPACATSISGSLSIVPTGASGQGYIGSASNVSSFGGTGWQQISGNVAASSQSGNYSNVPLLTPQTFYYLVGGSATVELSVTVNSYTL